MLRSWRIPAGTCWCLAFFTAAAVILLGAGPASATYPGRPGAIGFERHAGSIDANGVETDGFSLRFISPATGNRSTGVSCQGINLSDFGGNGVQYCPLLGPGFAPDSGPNWSPDGRSLVFSGALYANDGSRTPAAHGCPGSCEAIVLAGARGSDPRLVPVALGDAEQPAFLPDGTRLAFTGRDMDRGQPDVYTVATDGSGLTRLTTDGATEPAPCANGSIAYVHDHDLYLHAPGGGTRRLTHRGAALPDCSPDSRSVAFVREGALYTIAATGQSLRRLTPRHVVDGRPAFSPAGGLIAVTTTIETAGCASFESGQLIYRLQVLDLSGRPRRSDVIDREECAAAKPQNLGSVDWQPLSAANG